MFPKRIWAFPFSEKQVYLTFDDGPIPEVTPWVLDILEKHQAKATFFCIGDNVRKHPELFRRIISEGHAVGNHTFHHINGWKTKPKDYLENTLKAEAEITNHIIPTHPKRSRRVVNHTLLFRPPYGRITSKQAKQLLKKGYHIVMWDVLSADFDRSISEEKCLQNVMKHVHPGSIIVFHDSLKAEKNLRYVLPKVLNIISEMNYDFIAIE
jgi:peptidoglycan/xylan/chitin deacetylase (PgdA/CDA1 family)